MKNKILFMVITMLLLVACGKSENTEDRIVVCFEKDLYTVKVKDNLIVEEDKETEDKETEDKETEDKETDSAGSFDNTLSEIKLIGEDTSVEYTIAHGEEGTDIVYNNTLFKNLYSNIQSLDTIYDKNTLINFIIKTYKAKSNTIYTMITLDSDSSIEDIDTSDVECITIDEMLSGDVKYDTLKKKYNEKVYCMLQLIDSETRREVQMYIAKSYILVTSDGVSQEIDMTKYDSGIHIDNIESTVESEETAVESEETAVESEVTVE